MFNSKLNHKDPLQSKVAAMNNMDDFCYENKSSGATTKLNFFVVSKDE